MNRKSKPLNSVSIGIIKCLVVSTVTTHVRMPSIGNDTAPQSAVQVCQIATVVMETTQLVLSQFKNFLSWSIETVPRIISECYDLVKLCHINCSGPVFSRHTVVCHFMYFTNDMTDRWKQLHFSTLSHGKDTLFSLTQSFLDSA